MCVMLSTRLDFHERRPTLPSASLQHIITNSGKYQCGKLTAVPLSVFHGGLFCDCSTLFIDVTVH
jgi:hypothetical protein